MQRIVPNLWFDHKAAEAAEFYTRTFPDARIVDTKYYPTVGLADFQQDLAGDVLYVEFTVAGYRFSCINAGPEVTVNPSISFMLNFAPGDRDRLDELWGKLSLGGQALMPLQAYDFSPHYGWVQDKYGVSWQLMLHTGVDESRSFIVPSLLFTEAVRNQAEAAIRHYTSIFGGRVGAVVHYPAGDSPSAGGVMFGDFNLFGQWFAAMDSGLTHGFTFNFGTSLMVYCTDQAELDRWWSQLSAVPEAEQCGWCTDKFGVSWQLVPVNLEELMSKPGSFEKLMAMKKIDIAAFG